MSNMKLWKRPIWARHATKYPEIFDVYWGNFRMEKNSNITPEIIEARNLFVEDNHIKSGCNLAVIGDLVQEGYHDRASLELHCDFDHPEAYRTVDGEIIVLVSNYNAPPPEWLGMELYSKPLYIDRGCPTYIRRFTGWKEIRALVKSRRAYRKQMRQSAA